MSNYVGKKKIEKKKIGKKEFAARIIGALGISIVGIAEIIWLTQRAKVDITQQILLSTFFVIFLSYRLIFPLLPKRWQQQKTENKSSPILKKIRMNRATLIFPGLLLIVAITTSILLDFLDWLQFILPVTEIIFSSSQSLSFLQFFTLILTIVGISWSIKLAVNSTKEYPWLAAIVVIIVVVIVVFLL